MFLRNLPAVLLISCLGCASKSSLGPESWPEKQWTLAAPEALGFDSDRLALLVDDIAASGLGAHSLTIVRRGRLLLDVRFFPWDGARRHDLASCTKSLTATGLGLSLAQGRIDSLDAKLVSFFPERQIEALDARKQAITLSDALEMRSGLSCVSAPFEATLLEMLKSPDFVGFTLALPMAAQPGTRWNYCGPVSHALSAVVTQTTGQPLDEWLREQLFEPLGIGAVDAPRDAQGVTHGFGDMRMEPLDLARVGLLYQRAGRWKNRQLLPERWVSEATRSHGDGYGYHFWSDEQAFSARGRGGQYLYVNPGLELVIVTTGSLGPEGEPRFAELLTERLLPALRDPEGLPPNPSAEDRLRQRVELAASPPQAMEPQAPPSPFDAVAGQRFSLVENTLGWQSVVLEFSGATGSLTLTAGGETSILAFGLDGVARVSSARHFSYRPEVEVALAGRFQDERTLQLSFDTLADIDAGSLTLTLDETASTLTIDVFERTFLHDHIVFEGARE
jgi:CubicO group peptidase (beta-lactamase class C family)